MSCSNVTSVTKLAWLWNCVGHGVWHTGCWMNEWVNQEEALTYNFIVTWASWYQETSMWLWICPQILLKQPWTSKTTLVFPCPSGLSQARSSSWSLGHSSPSELWRKIIGANCSEAVISIKLSCEWLAVWWKFLCRRTTLWPVRALILSLLCSETQLWSTICQQRQAAASVSVSADICANSGGLAWRPFQVGVRLRGARLRLGAFGEILPGLFNLKPPVMERQVLAFSRAGRLFQDFCIPWCIKPYGSSSFLLLS